MLDPGIKIEKKKDKRPSQMLRDVIYRYWEQIGSNEEFDPFYRRHVVAIVEQYKSKLTKKGGSL